MEDKTVRITPRERQIVNLLLQGCDNREIAKELNMARRTVKAHFNRLFLRFGITDGIKRVKLAILFYRRQACQKSNSMGTVSLLSVNTESPRLLLRPEEQGSGKCDRNHGTRDKELHEGDLRQARALELRGTGALVRNEAQSRTCFIALMNSYEFGGVVRAPARNQGCQHEPITERSMCAAENAHPLFHRNPDTDKA